VLPGRPRYELSERLWLFEGQRRLRPVGVASEPEIENWPYAAWAKSDQQTWSEKTAAQFVGSEALLINAYPNHERQVIERYPQVGDMLRRSRPALDWIAARYPRDAESLGVGLPFRADAAAHLHAHGGDLTYDLEAVWTEVLAADGTSWGAGRTAFRSELGGCVVGWS
jgi:hypothetical protein